MTNEQAGNLLVAVMLKKWVASTGVNEVIIERRELELLAQNLWDNSMPFSAFQSHIDRKTGAITISLSTTPSKQQLWARVVVRHAKGQTPPPSAFALLKSHIGRWFKADRNFPSHKL